MIQAKIIEKTFDFRYSLEERSYTDMLVINHTVERGRPEYSIELGTIDLD